MKTVYNYEECIGQETQDKEYKLFTLHPRGNNLDPNDKMYAEHLLETGSWVFNKPVLENIDYYLENYIPRYTSAFLNSESVCKHAEMYFGISDEGIVQGIPFKGELDIEIIKSKVNDILSSDLLKANTNLQEYINVELIKIKTNSFNLNNYKSNIIDTYHKQKSVYDKEFAKFKSRKNKWLNMMEYYSNKLGNLVNNQNTREELIKYIELYGPNRKNLLRTLRSGFIYDVPSGEEIGILKTQEDTIWHWLTRWKDDMSFFVKSLKPYPPQGISNYLYPCNLITTVVDMIPTWLKNNNDLNLYLFKFTFSKPDTNLNISYKNSFGEYVHCYRTVFDGEPCCIPY